MAGIRSYKDLGVWQKAIELVVACYAVTRRFPPSERFAVANQIQRAAVSIAANIAEGHGRSGPREFLRFLSIARGSLRELETLLIIACRVGYTTEETHRALMMQTDEIGRMLFSLTTRIAARAKKDRPRSLTPDP